MGERKEQGQQPIGEEEAQDKERGREELAQEMRKLEEQQKQLLEARQQAETAFKNFDRRQQEMLNLMAQIAKTMNEVRNSVIKNLL